jgi:hypothetical protein
VRAGPAGSFFQPSGLKASNILRIDEHSEERRNPWAPFY